MKLLLTSAGFTTPDIIDAAISLCDKPVQDIRIAIINEAYAMIRGGCRWVINDLRRVGDAFPGEIDIVNLLALSPEQQAERFAKADLIFVLGGHTDYLMHVFNVSGFSTLLPELLKTKLYVGSSAGGMVMGKRLTSEAYKLFYGEDEDGFNAPSFLGYVDFATLPHYDTQDFPNNTKKFVLQTSTTVPQRIYALNDQQAIIIDGSTMSFVGGAPVCAENGTFITT